MGDHNSASCDSRLWQWHAWTARTRAYRKGRYVDGWATMGTWQNLIISQVSGCIFFFFFFSLSSVNPECQLAGNLLIRDRSMGVGLFPRNAKRYLRKCLDDWAYLNDLQFNPYNLHHNILLAFDALAVLFSSFFFFCPIVQPIYRVPIRIRWFSSKNWLDVSCF